MTTPRDGSADGSDPAEESPSSPPPAETVSVTGEGRNSMPRWLPRGILLFWSGLVVLVVLRWLLGKTRGLLILILVSIIPVYIAQRVAGAESATTR